MINKKISLLVSVILLLMSSCQKWLKITPTDQFSASELFTNKDGYLKAINGIYVDMTASRSYGQTLSVGAIDALAHYYHINSSTHNYYEVASHIYTDSTSIRIFDGIWSSSYKMIADANVLLEKTPNSPGGILPQPYYSIVKGEALALRAFLHFDLLRLFGPVWTADKINVPTLPYALHSGTDLHPLLSPKEYLDQVIKDLEEAARLLADDPIRSSGVRHEENPTGDNSLYFRQYRLNYYAVQALLCRAYQWKQDREKTYSLAKDLLSEINPGPNSKFPFVSNANATHNTLKDRLFSTEVIFSLYTNNRNNLFNSTFSSILPKVQKLTFNLDNSDYSRVRELYDDENDYREDIWQLRTDNSITSLTCTKFEAIANAPGQYMMPLIRLSEIILMLAESSPLQAEGVEYLNTVRRSRNAVNLNPTDRNALLQFISKEFRKEMIGEGQQFYYYKRTQQANLPRIDRLTGTATMFLQNYVIPVPDSEIAVRSN